MSIQQKITGINAFLTLIEKQNKETHLIFNNEKKGKFGQHFTYTFSGFLKSNNTSNNTSIANVNLVLHTQPAVSSCYLELNNDIVIHLIYRNLVHNTEQKSKSILITDIIKAVNKEIQELADELKYLEIKKNSNTRPNNATIQPQIKKSWIIKIEYSRTITENNPEGESLNFYDPLIQALIPPGYSTPQKSFIFNNISKNLEINDHMYNGIYTIVKYTFTNISIKSNITNAINDGFNNNGINNDGFFEVELTSDGKILKSQQVQKQLKTNKTRSRQIKLDIKGKLTEDNVWVTDEIKYAIKQTALIFNETLNYNNNSSSIPVFERVAILLNTKFALNSGGARNKIGSLESLTVKELIVRAKAKQIAYSGLKKIDLIARIRQKGSKK